jgi:hypothetical protein
VYECEPGSRPVIILTNQPRFGPDILTIPAWLSRGKAEQLMRDAEGALRSNTIIEVRHPELQKMIEEGRYDPHYSPALDYHLDIEAEQEEIDAFLGSE